VPCALINAAGTGVLQDFYKFMLKNVLSEPNQPLKRSNATTDDTERHNRTAIFLSSSGDFRKNGFEIDIK